MMETEIRFLMGCFLIGISGGILLKFISEIIFSTVKSLFGVFRNITR